MAFLNRVSGVLRQTTSNHMPVELSASSTSLFQAIRNMSSKLFIGGLSYGTDEMSLREAFSQHGEVVEARIIMDRETGRSRGFGFVTFTSNEEASSAIGALDGQELHGRRIKVNHATERARGGGFRGDFGGVGGGGYGGYGNNSYGGSGGYGNNNYRGAGGYGDGGYGGNAGGYGNTSTYGGNPGGGYGNSNYGGQPGYDNNYGSSNNMINHDNVASGFGGQYGGGAGGDTSTPTGDYFNTGAGMDGGSVPYQGESGDGQTAAGNQN